MALAHSILGDFYECFKNRHIWLILSFYDIKARYRRTAIGPFWLTLGTGTTILGMGVVWSAIFKTNVQEFLPYIAVGMIIWTFVASILNESCSVFTSQVSIIHNIKTSYFMHVFTMVSRNIIIMLHNLPVLILVMIFCNQPITFKILWVFPSLFLLILNSFWVGVTLGIFATRYRDLTAIVANVMTLIMLVTPIMWKPDMLQGNRHFIVMFNPFFHIISIVRDPLLGKTPALESYLIVIGIVFAGFSFSLWLYKKFVHRIVFWM